MEALIQVFRMVEVSPQVRAKIIVQLGNAINSEYAMNISEPLVYELVKNLDPKNEILKNEHYLSFVK